MLFLGVREYDENNYEGGVGRDFARGKDIRNGDVSHLSSVNLYPPRARCIHV